ncbi:helix-turn-helix domain-containing protein [Halobacillus sp. SY10]|uniref:helix-turn-helix domain-containing protein n=1 Tax=Halobacillus TaxID=45667 RepID=UPI000B7FA9A5|nr:helix-turn-helix transcriptional regulator [Halobacillus aidingensis]
MDKKREAEVRQIFGQRLKNIRLEKGLSQEEVAFRSGFDRTYISGMERGLKNPFLITIESQADALDVNTDSFFKD